jgi:hypothetical protein
MQTNHSYGLINVHGLMCQVSTPRLRIKLGFINGVSVGIDPEAELYDASLATKRVVEQNPFDSVQHQLRVGMRSQRRHVNDNSSRAVIAASILCVGAGRVGCGLLKALVLSGVKRVDVVRPILRQCKRIRDCTHILTPPLPKIDVGAVEPKDGHQRFIFRQEHVGRSKAGVAASHVRSLAPSVHIRPWHADVRDARLGVNFVKGFDLVLSARSATRPPTCTSAD